MVSLPDSHLKSLALCTGKAETHWQDEDRIIIVFITPVTQLELEYLTSNQKVTGSSPVGGAIKQLELLTRTYIKIG